MPTDISVIILTYNEEIHLERTLQNIKKLTDQIIIVDSFSTDKTEEISKKYGAQFFQHKFTNQAFQLNWAIDNIDFPSEWILRLDADEYLMPELIEEINVKLPKIEKNVTGVFMKRRVFFMNQWIKYGGYYPTWILRLWRKGYGRSEEKWMDEHLILSEGETIKFEHDFVDHNLNNLTWWISKHNNYATREALEALNHKYNFLPSKNIEAKLDKDKQDSTKRWFKENIYSKIPLFIRPMFYFIFRYFIKLGFLDGVRGFIWHTLQGFWFRFLVDAKTYQIEKLAKEKNIPITEVIKKEFNIKF